MRCEKEGLARSLTFLEEAGLVVDTIVTDRHPMIQKYLREQHQSITHYYDVWHVSKGLLFEKFSIPRNISIFLEKK